MTITVICAWCGKSLGEKDGQGVEGISHGICEDCLKAIVGKVVRAGIPNILGIRILEEEVLKVTARKE